MHLDIWRFRLRLVWHRLGRPRSLLHWARARRAYAARRTEVDALPVSVDVEPINACNFRCAHCQVTHWSKPRTSLTRAAFERVLAQLPSLWRVKLQGMGEPFLSKETVPMLQAGDERGLEMVVITNGSALTEETARRLAALRGAHVVVSMDGASAPVFEAARIGGKFDQVVANTRRLAGLRRGAGRPAVELHSVITSRNVHELEGIVRLCKELGADRLTIQLAITDWGKQHLREHTVAKGVDARAPDVKARLEGAARLARELGVTLNVLGASGFTRERPCAAPWTTTYVAANGDVVPCCVIADADVAKMGNVLEQPFAEIWNGPAYRELRDRLRRHDLPAYCRNCYADPPPGE